MSTHFGLLLHKTHQFEKMPRLFDCLRSLKLYSTLFTLDLPSFTFLPTLNPNASTGSGYPFYLKKKYFFLKIFRHSSEQTIKQACIKNYVQWSFNDIILPSQFSFHLSDNIINRRYSIQLSSSKTFSLENLC